MKKVLALFMCLCMVACLAACGKGEDKKTTTTTKVTVKDDYKGKFRVGFGRESVMPEESVPLGGFGATSNRLSNGYLNDIYADCTAISDQDNKTLLVFAYDSVGSNAKFGNELVTTISKATGVPEDNIIINHSHSHSTPDTRNTELGTILEYTASLPAIFVKAAETALNSRVPAKMYYGETQAQGLNFVRHYFAQNADGGETFALGDNHKDLGFKGKLLGHTTESDHTVFTVKFERENNEKDVYLVSFRAHPTFTGGSAKYDVSSDWVGPLRENVEKELDAYCTYLQGAAGNNNSKSRIAGESRADYFRDHGKYLAEYVINTAKNLTEVKTGSIVNKTWIYTGAVNHADDGKVGLAQVVANYWNTSYDGTGAKKLAETYGMASQYHANAIINRSKMGQTQDVKLTCFAIGDLAFTGGSFEQFDTNSRYIIDNSPYKYTIPLGYTGYQQGYIPSKFAFEYGCYESDTTAFVAGTGEDIANDLLAKLNDAKKLSK